MDALYDRLRLRAATIDELLSDAFTALPGATADADLTGRRVAAWCRASAAGDEALFARRLARDGLTIDRLRQRLRCHPAEPGRSTSGVDRRRRLGPGCAARPGTDTDNAAASRTGCVRRAVPPPRRPGRAAALVGA